MTTKEINTELADMAGEGRWVGRLRVFDDIRAALTERDELLKERYDLKQVIQELAGWKAEYVRRAREIEIKPWGFVMTTDIKKAISLIRDLAAEKGE